MLDFLLVFNLTLSLLVVLLSIFLTRATDFFGFSGFASIINYFSSGTQYRFNANDPARNPGTGCYSSLRSANVPQ